ncbi:RDD family protein [Pseudomonas cichorii]|nr:RDD family protein [Pseudomonas cichorii]MBX8488454.1 RDD family protein [Pseudomonas cichorii]MBX8568523.1 RDD family protein [Pseudomonas cichorii]MBX8596437.1 RDD family protein [Pseudomonas cichorii]MBX8615635.1 RDD family protein [Pseudomonas cichorii]
MENDNTQNEYQKPKNLAGLRRRWGGQMIDSLFTVFLFYSLLYLTGYAGLPTGVAAAITIGSSVGYYLFSDALPNGQSLGKKLLGMSVIDERSYLNCNLYQSFIRNITTPILSIFDWIFIFFGSRKRLGDMLASTIVIRSS